MQFNERLLLLAVLVLASISYSNAGQIKRESDLERAFYKGRICSTTESTAELVLIRGREVERRSFPQVRDTYDGEGRLLSVVSFDDGEPSSRDQFTYVVSGDVVRETHYNPKYFDKGDGGYPYGEPLDDNGWMIVRTLLRRDFDEKGRLVTTTEFDAKSNEPERHVIRSYDPQGRLREERTERISTGAEVSRSVFEYNTKGEVASAELYSRGALHMRSVYSDYRYDRSGNWYRRTAASEMLSQGKKFRAYEYREIAYCGQNGRRRT